MKVLIVKTSSLGDIIHAFPVIIYLKEEFPSAQIDWVVEKSLSDVVKAHPSINHVIEIDTKSWRKNILKMKTWKEIFNFRKDIQAEEYDVVIDLQGNTKSAFPTFLARSKHKIGFGIKTIHEWPNLWVTHQRYNPPLYLNVRDENLYIVQHYFCRYRQIEDEKVVLKLSHDQQRDFDAIVESWSSLAGKKILVCPGSAWKNKQLDPQALEDFLHYIEANFDIAFIFATGSQKEKNEMEDLAKKLKNLPVILDRLPLPLLQNIMAKMHLVIAMDSLPLHLAATTGVPTFSVFGASSAQKYKPKGPNHLALKGDCPYGRNFERRCPILRTCSTGLCIRGITGKKLYHELLNGNLF